jgi:hypothetical protein
LGNFDGLLKESGSEGYILILKKQNSKKNKIHSGKWPNARKRLESLANTALVTVPLSVNKSRRWKLPSMRRTPAPSVARMPSREKPWVSGPAVRAKRPWPVVPGLLEPLLLPLSDRLSDDVMLLLILYILF